MENSTAYQHPIGEKIVLVTLDNDREYDWTPEDILAEMTELVETAGGHVVQTFVQKRNTPDVSFYIGKGKAEEIASFSNDNDIDIVIFSDELSPRQKRNLQEISNSRIIDRTELILDIFAQRARSREGKLQVELAQLNYLLPRLTGKGLSLSRLGGGIGTRGPGETKLETDRRHIRNRIYEINREINLVKKQRELHRKQRNHVSVITVSLIGYTNAGKSTLINYLTQAGVLAEDKLFATLDPTTRKVSLPRNHEILLTDTVGFIHNLPHHLIAAFRATLEEVAAADVLLHVVDISHEKYPEHMKSVQQVLSEIGIEDKKTFTALNKIDRLDPGTPVHRWSDNIADSYPISAKTGEGIPKLLEAIASYLDQNRILISARIPYARGDLKGILYERGQVLTEAHLENTTEITAYIRRADLHYFEQYLI